MLGKDVVFMRCEGYLGNDLLSFGLRVPAVMTPRVPSGITSSHLVT